MTYDELESSINGAWELFFNHLGFVGVDTDRLVTLMDQKDCFNDVSDCIYQSVECEEE